jgi:hypothetical protein
VYNKVVQIKALGSKVALPVEVIDIPYAIFT